MIRKTSLAFCLAAFAATAAAPAMAEVTPHEFKVIGTWGNLSSWQEVEQPFWAKTLPEISGGKLTAQAIPITEAGLKGTEVMRLLSQGVFEVAHGLGGYVAAENPAIEGMDLSGIAPDYPEMRKITDAYRPVMDETFRKTYGATILAVHPFARSMIYCRDPITSLADLKGRKVRVHSATLGDFIEGAGGVVVTLPFAEVVPALEKGVADCAVTDAVSAYKASWQEVTRHVYPLPISYSTVFTAINEKLWNGMDEDSRKVMASALKEMEDKGWQLAQTQEAQGVACMTGTGDCPFGKPGKATLHEISPNDAAEIKRILNDFVLKRWGQRCGAECAARWNETAGKVAGLSVPAQ